jgi:hypothetical protein
MPRAGFKQAACRMMDNFGQKTTVTYVLDSHLRPTVRNVPHTR